MTIFASKLQKHSIPSQDVASLDLVDTGDGLGGDGAMGRITRNAVPKLTLTLVGNFALSAPDGTTIRISEKKGRVLLAMLATARDMRRSREWLRSRIWSRSFEAQASASLRQSLHALRRALGPHADILQADYDHVWLENVVLNLSQSGRSQRDFFEDAPALGDDYEDWLRQERAALENRFEATARPQITSSILPAVAPAPADRPCVVMATPVAISNDPRAAAVAERICNSMAATFRLNGYLDIYDLRDLQTNQLSDISAQSAIHPQLLVEVRVSLIGEELQAAVVARIPSSGKIVWTASLASDRDSAFQISSDTMTEFVMGAVDSIETVVLRQPDYASQATLYTAVHQLFGLSREGIGDASILLNGLANTQRSPIAEAWLGFATVLMLGERLDDKREAMIARAAAHIETAMEAEPSNAVILALAGHFESFVRRDFDLGRSYLDESLRQVPNLAFAWDARAMNAIYQGDVKTGAWAAETARKLGRYSPYRFYYDASAVIAATLEGRHRDAIVLGNRVLAKRPNFLPVMRHMCASHAELGNTADAMDFFRRLRTLDPVFGTPDMASRDYVLPAQASVDIIQGALGRIGLLVR